MGAALARIRELCLALPETSEKVDHLAHSFEVRRRSFCLCIDDARSPVIVFPTSPDDREAFLAIGRPFFEVATNHRKVGLVLGEETDWDEVRELVTDAYCRLAPKKLIALAALPPTRSERA